MQLDGLPAPSGAYSFRRLLSAYAGSAVRLRRASDSAELDINFLGYVPGLGAPLDVAAANAHCAATTCFVAKWYDQSGLGLDLVQATAANQPAFVFNCLGAQPCVQYTAATQTLNTVASVTPATGIVSMSVVANRAAGLGLSVPVRQNGATGNRVRFGGANLMSSLGGTSGGVGAAASDGVWHSAVFTINNLPTGSVTAIDGAETVSASAVVGSTVAGQQGLVGTGSTTINQVEMLVFDNVELSPNGRMFLGANQRGFWGVPQ